MESSYTIEPKIIEVFHRYVFEYPVEICANLIKTERNTLIPYDVVRGTLVEYGSSNKFRGTCNYKTYSSNIFHSHPISSYAYPSKEDVIHVIKKYGKIVNSIIATKWGIWVISNTTESNIYNRSDEEALKTWVGIYLAKIGDATRTSDEERKSKPDKSKDLVSDDYNVINKRINTISLKLKIKIDLHTWDEVINTGIVVNDLTES